MTNVQVFCSKQSHAAEGAKQILSHPELQGRFAIAHYEDVASPEETEALTTLCQFISSNSQRSCLTHAMRQKQKLVEAKPSDIKHLSHRAREKWLEEVVRLGDMRPGVKKQLIDAKAPMVLGDVLKDPKKKRLRHYYGLHRPESFNPHRWKTEMKKGDYSTLMSNSDCVRAMEFFKYSLTAAIKNK